MESSRVVITFQRPIAFEKNEHFLENPYAHFVLRIDNTTIGYGTVLKYAPVSK
jgi:hypothetical protein